MNELEKNIPDNLWQKAFDDAAETPPPRVWDAIERRLDESDKNAGLGARIVPLWGTGQLKSQPFAWAVGIAAAVLLLLVGEWVANRKSTIQSIAQIQRSKFAGNREKTPDRSINSIASEVPKQSDRAAVLTPTPTVASMLVSNQTIKAARASSGNSTAQIALSSTRKRNSLSAHQLARDSQFTHPINTLANPSLSIFHSSPTNSYTDNSSSELTDNKITSTYLKLLASRSIHLRKLGPIQRIVWFRPAELMQEPAQRESKRQSKEKWASVSVMPSTFNPSVSVRSVGTSVASFNASTTKQSTVNSRADFSVAYQAGAGVQLTERWSVESGVGYLAGHATVEAPAQLGGVGYAQSINNYRVGETNNLYVDALRNSSRSNTGSKAAPMSYDNVGSNLYITQNVYDDRTQNVVANDYQYMQVPIQVGYQLRPRKRLSMAVLGGLLTNIFVRNTAGKELTITAKDGIYRPVSLAATMGARFRYRPTGRWSASLAGVYQPALELGTQSSSQVQSRPTSTGMSFGLDYHF